MLSVNLRVSALGSPALLSITPRPCSVEKRDKLIGLHPRLNFDGLKLRFVVILGVGWTLPSPPHAGEILKASINLA